MNLPSVNELNIDPDYIIPGISQTTNSSEQEPGGSLNKVKTIINREFKHELELRQKQIDLIQKRVVKVSKMLHLIRYVLVNSYYDDFETVQQEIEEKVYQLPSNQDRVHPAIKKLLGSDQQIQILYEKRQIHKSAPNKLNIGSTEQSLRVPTHNNSEINLQEDNNSESKNSLLKNDYKGTKKAKTSHQKQDDDECQTASSVLRNRVLTKHVIIVGNISKYNPSKNPQDKLVHKWMVYVRGTKESPNISGFVHKVVFYLHPSYKPNDIVEVEEYPFHLTRRGWGEFPLRIRIYFKNNFNKPVDIIHNLRLDKTYIGRQTLGSETVVQVNLYDATETSNYFKDAEILENEETMQNVDIAEDTFSINNPIKIEPINIPDHLLTDEQLDTNSFLMNQLDIVQNIKQEKCDELSSEYNFYPFNSSLRNSTDCDILELQQIVDVDHSYSRYTILSGIKRKVSEIPIHHCKRIKSENGISENEDTDSRYSIKIYDMSRLRTTIQMITTLLRKMPLVTELAYDRNYKSIFPYSARNLYEYRMWNIAKRQASEWGRARMIRNAIINSDLPNSTTWSTKKIVLFARAYGFTPIANYTPFRRPIYQQHLLDLKSPAVLRIAPPVISDHFQVDITNNSIGDLQMNGFAKTKICMVNSLTRKYDGFVKDAALEMGVILRDDEIVAGVCHNTTETLLLRAVMCFAEDLLRCARADAVYKGQLRHAEGCIQSENVINALNTYREEFTHVTTFNKYTKLF